MTRTSPTPDVRDQLAERQHLIDALCRADEDLGIGLPPEELADALLPTVERLRREAAAEALRLAADALSRPSEGAAYQVWAYGGGDWLRTRAAAVDPSGGES